MFLLIVDKMSEVSRASADVNKCTARDSAASQVKQERDVVVKQEAVECSLCLVRAAEHSDAAAAATAAGTRLHDYLCKCTHTDLAKIATCARVICKPCLNLVNVLEQAELDYLKVKQEFLNVISKNPLFDHKSQVELELVKNERSEIFNDESEDEPLSLTKQKRCRKMDKRKKKIVANTSIKAHSTSNDHNGWECMECNACGESGGQSALTAHMLLSHSPPSSLHTNSVPYPTSLKQEDLSDRSQSPSYEENIDDIFKMEDDYDDDETYVPEIVSNGKHRGRSIVGRRIRSQAEGKAAKKKDPKVVHQCDQCNAKYTSLVRLEQHKRKHEGSKPPYICEVCGAHYKHKRACDIHVAMHKGISDWKCEECNKLFPSKGALQRHNNIHTGKLNYQCDLCGKSFIHTSSFKMHKLSHSGVKPHACDVCGLALMTRSHLKRHKRVHSGEKRHECAVCGKRFSERYNLLAHARSHAGDAALAHGAAAAAAAAVVRRRLFRCAFCPERFERRYMLERHAGAAHGRALERPPPTPRNTMSKLLKAQAQRRDLHTDTHLPDGDMKINRSPDTRTSSAASAASHKHAPHLSGSAGGAAGEAGGAAGGAAASSWAGVYAAEFGLRADYSH